MRALVVVAFGCHAATPAATASATSCVTVADHVRGLVGDVTDRAHRIGAAFLRRCTDDTWPEPIKQCFLGEADVHARHHCQARLATEQRAMLQRDLELARLPPVDTTRDPCDHLRYLAQRIDTCAALATETRDELREMAARVLGPTTPPNGVAIRPFVVRRQLSEFDEGDTKQECQLGVDAIVKLGAEQCGW